MTNEQIKIAQEELAWSMYEGKISQAQYNEAVKHIQEVKRLNKDRE